MFGDLSDISPDEAKQAIAERDYLANVLRTLYLMSWADGSGNLKLTPKRLHLVLEGCDEKKNMLTMLRERVFYRETT